MKQQSRLCATAVVCLFSSTLSCFTTACSQPKSLTILHTNDMHASFTPHEAMWIKTGSKPLVGGFRELGFAVDSIRNVKPSTLLLDAGDVMTGNPITEIQYRGVYGGALFEMMNRIGYDAWCPGNHDFDISQENFIHIAQLARFPTLSSNLVHDTGAFEPAVKEFIVVEKGGIRIGVIGLMTQELYGLVFQKNLTGIKVLAPVETAQKLIDRLDPETDLLIAVTHQGVEDDSILAAGVRGLDIIVGGHSHTRLRQPKIVNGVMIVQTGSNAENLGVLDVNIEDDRVISHNGKLVQLWSRPDRPETGLAQFIDSLQGEIHREFSEVIGTLQEDWVRGQGESGMGNFITDAQRDAAGAQVAFMNTHGIRRDVTAGPLTKLELFEVLPFRNMLGTFQLSGTQLKTVVLHHLKERTAIQTSGFTCRWRKKSNGDAEIVELNVQGEPVRDDRMYICAASDYLIGEARRYLGMEILQPIFLQETLYAVVEEAVRNAKTISSGIEHRIREINNQ